MPYRKFANIFAHVLSSSLNEAVAFSSYRYLFKVARVTLTHKSCFKFDFKNNILISVLPFLNKVFERTLHFGIQIFFQSMLITKINKASSGTNQQLMLYSNSSRSVTRHLIVKNNLFQSFTTSVGRLILFVMTLP